MEYISFVLSEAVTWDWYSIVLYSFPVGFAVSVYSQITSSMAHSQETKRMQEKLEDQKKTIDALQYYIKPLSQHLKTRIERLKQIDDHAAEEQRQCQEYIQGLKTNVIVVPRIMQLKKSASEPHAATWNRMIVSWGHACEKEPFIIRHPSLLALRGGVYLTWERHPADIQIEGWLWTLCSHGVYKIPLYANDITLDCMLGIKRIECVVDINDKKDMTKERWKILHTLFSLPYFGALGESLKPMYVDQVHQMDTMIRAIVNSV